MDGQMTIPKCFLRQFQKRAATYEQRYEAGEWTEADAVSAAKDFEELKASAYQSLPEARPTQNHINKYRRLMTQKEKL